MATDALQQFIAGPLGHAPATEAAQAAFSSYQVPTITNNLALAGLGNSGAVGDAIARGEAEALTPLLQQEATNRLAATGQLGNIGGNLGGRSLTAAQIFSGLGLGQGQLQLGGANLLANIGENSAARQLQALQMQSGLAGQQMSEGQVLASRVRGDTQAALEASGIPQQLAEQISTAAFNDFLRRQGLAEAATLQPVGSSLPRMIGSTTSSSGDGRMFGS
jgi:hypothetical protein